ncbi:MAG TPA: HAD family hydrolase [Streptosporangiaceae bacterium]|nr:HAD family hydrolase [Streptosporangiaceae bacterium]
MSSVNAILLDAGGVMIFPSPELLLPPLRAAGLDPSPADLQRAHYWAMAVCDEPGREAPGAGWWREYLRDCVLALGVPETAADDVAGQIVSLTDGFGWTHVGPGVPDALRGLAALGLPIGIVSNSTGEVENVLRRLDVCYAPARSEADGCRGVEVGVVIDSAVVGVSKPDPRIFGLALDALGVPSASSDRVIHVGDSLRYDVTGAIAAGLRPVHLDPYGFCPAPDGHEHLRRLDELPDLIAGRLPPAETRHRRPPGT